MGRLLRQHRHLLIALAAFAAVSAAVQMNVEWLQAVFQASPPGVSVALFILLGVALVIIPTASILPFMPIAVAFWGWPLAAVLTLVAWVIGGQILFEAARRFGRPLVAKVLPARALSAAAGIVRGGFLHSVLVRTVLHGDLVSYAFGLFSGVGRVEYAAVSAIGVAPAAVLYAYLGSLPLWIQLSALAAVGALLAWGLRPRHEDAVFPGDAPRLMPGKEAGLARLLRRMASTMSPLKKYGYLWVTLAFFLFSIAGHWLFAWFAYVGEQASDGKPVQVSEYLMQTTRDTFENWQSEFPQLIWQVCGSRISSTSVPLNRKRGTNAWRRRSTVSSRKCIRREKR